MSLAQTIIAFVVALAILIVVHEYGHYLVARLCGVKVLRFSVGFGRPLFTRRFGPDRTEWSVSAIPFGGYVKMLDEREGEVPPAELHRAFNRQSVWRRMLIVAAGPFFNFVFAVLAYAAIFMVGLPEAKPLLAEPPKGTLAQTAGLREGDLVRSVVGQPVATWQDVRWQLLQAALERRVVSLEVGRRSGGSAVEELDFRGIDSEEVDGSVLERAGLRLSRPSLAPVIGGLTEGGVAQRAGIRPGDLVRSVDGRPVRSWESLVEIVRASPDRRLVVELQRDAAMLTVEMTPEATGPAGSRVGRIGAGPLVPVGYAEDMLVTVRHGPLSALGRAAAKTWDVSIFTLRMIGKMIVGEVSWKHISGPVTIADIAGQSAQLGWLPYLNFLGLISISLGVLNLLPIPLLDGGHLMYYLIEIIKGGPVSERALELGQRVGITLLLLMMAFAFYNDINRLISG
jgi:regulator of sigma E protease